MVRRVVRERERSGGDELDRRRRRSPVGTSSTGGEGSTTGSGGDELDRWRRRRSQVAGAEEEELGRWRGEEELPAAAGVEGWAPAHIQACFARLSCMRTRTI
jgi:hypothetical protein